MFSHHKIKALQNPAFLVSGFGIAHQELVAEGYFMSALGLTIEIEKKMNEMI